MNFMDEFEQFLRATVSEKMNLAINLGYCKQPSPKNQRTQYGLYRCEQFRCPVPPIVAQNGPVLNNGCVAPPYGPRSRGNLV